MATGSWQCRKGSTLLIPSGPREDHKHLFALMLDPLMAPSYGSQPHVLLACVTSIKEGSEPLEDCCLLNPGDHPFVQHPSYVDYRFTRLERLDHVQKCVDQGTFIAKEPCSPELIRRIVAGALRSRRISREYKHLLASVVLP